MIRSVQFPTSITIYPDKNPPYVCGGMNLDVPDVCPICGVWISPIMLHSSTHKDVNEGYLVCVYRCTSCQRPFIASYRTRSSSLIELTYTAPKTFVARDFPQPIKVLSPKFVEIFNQSVAAETHNLNEIAGIGYRKALEFLIKDLAIHTHPDDWEKIETMQLSKCINDYIDYQSLKTTAIGAAWLGNDQVHYKQKYTDRDLNDLKRFMDNAINWVNLVLGTEEAADLIENGQS